jgi:hypothetical protein
MNPFQLIAYTIRVVQIDEFQTIIRDHDSVGFQDPELDQGVSRDLLLENQRDSLVLSVPRSIAEEFCVDRTIT